MYVERRCPRRRQSFEHTSKTGCSSRYTAHTRVSAASATAVLMDRGVYRHAVHSVNCEGCFVVEVVGFVRTWESEGGWGWGGKVIFVAVRLTELL